METKTDTHYLRAAWICILGFCIFRIIYAGSFPLVPDETNYWQWSRHLDWGYHDQAPMIGWAIALTTALLGHTETAVRLPSIIALTIASIYMMLMARRWFGSRVAFYATLLGQSVLEFNVGGLLATADGLQAAGWAAAAYHVARGYEDNRWGQWIAGGLWFGFGFLSKFTMVIFLPCAFLYGLVSGLHRSRLGQIRPYVGVAMGALMFSPVIYWNAANNWNSVRHVAYLGGANETFSLHWKYFGDFLGSQAALLSPLVFVLILAVWGSFVMKKYQKNQWIYSYLAFTSLPMVAFFALLSLHSRVYGNWPGAGYLTACVLVAERFARPVKTTGSPSKLWRWTLGTSFAITAIVLLQTACPVIPIPARYDRIATEILGWKELGQKAEQLKSNMPMPEQTFLFGVRYQIASELAFYAPGKPETVSINRWRRPNVYDYWWEDQGLLGWDAVGVTVSPQNTKKLLEVFERVDEPVELKIYKTRGLFIDDLFREPVKTFYLYRAYGFKGGLRWQPRDAKDIRRAG